MTPEPCDIEIVEVAPGDVMGPVSPNEVRINGRPVLVPDQPVIIHEMQIDGGKLVQVTLTLYARRVTIGQEQKS